MKKYVKTLNRGMVVVFTMMLVVTLMVMLPANVFAAGRTGTVTFSMIYGENTPVGGGELSVYRVESGKRTLVGTVSIDSKGHGSISGLSDGEYYVEQTKTASGYGKCTSFTFTIPYEGSYYLHAEPKISPDTPDNPNNPDNPDSPDTPDNPDSPDNPDNPDEPDQPDNPDEPNKPDNPNTPDEPDKPDNPNTPDEPDHPDNPNTPDEPDQPDNPNTPDEPDQPDNPNTPDEPDSPDNPLTPTDSKNRLPQTGQLWWPVWLLSGAGIAFIVAGLLIHMKRTDE